MSPPSKTETQFGLLLEPSLITWGYGFLLVLLLLFLAVSNARSLLKVFWQSPQLHEGDALDPDEEITPLRDLDVATTEPHPYRPWKAGKFVMSMGILRVKHEDWLQLDNRYWEEQALRRDLLTNKRDGVTQMLPGAEAACSEALDLIVDYLTRRFPHLFFYLDDKPDHLHNKLTGMTFKVTTPYDMPPLQVAAQLVMEDLNILMPGYGGDSQQYYL